MSTFNDLETTISKLTSKDNNIITEVSSKLSTYFGKVVQVAVTPVNKNDAFFVLCVSPEIPTIDNIIEFLSDEKANIQTILDIWHNAPKWRIDIDGKILKLLTQKELTALIIYGLWYSMRSDNVPLRLINKVQFGIANASLGQRAMFRDAYFREILRIPVLSSCEIIPTDNKELQSAITKGIREIPEEDLFGEFMKEKDSGYLTSLLSAIDKIKKKSNCSCSADQNTEDSLMTVEEIIDSVSKGKGREGIDKLRSMQKLIPEHCAMFESVEELSGKWFPDDGVDKYVMESAAKITADSYFMEFGLHLHRLQPIERNQIDYVTIKSQEMRTMNDKMMCVSYINSKLEMIEYYRGILMDPKMSKRYRVPHTMSQLDSMYKELNSLRDRVINTPIKTKNIGLTIEYPSGYDG